MATTKQFSVTLHPAKRDGAFISTQFVLCGTYPTKKFDASRMEDVIGIVNAFANEYGQGCQASVRCLSARKPAGFDKATTSLYFNI